MDPIRVGTHCFGSREGYRTLSRSADVTDAEDAELRGFGFGQTADSSFLERLEREPSAFGRPLAGGRVAITRIFQGDPDEAGRATLELRTILVAAPDMAPLAKAGLGAILQLPGLWKRDAFRRGVLREIAVPPELATPAAHEHVAAERLFDAWAAAVLPERLERGAAITLVPAESRPVIVVEPESLGSAAIASLAARLSAPDLARLRWGVRLVSTAGPVDLCTLAAAGRSGGRRDTRRVRLEPSPEARPQDPSEHPLVLARVAAERSVAVSIDAGRTSVLRPIAITIGALLGLLLIAWITWISIFAALERDPVAARDSLLASTPPAAREGSGSAANATPAPLADGDAAADVDPSAAPAQTDADAPESSETVASDPTTPDDPESPTPAPESSADDSTPSDGSLAPSQADPVEQDPSSTDSDAPESSETVASDPTTPDDPESPMPAPESSADDPTPSDGRSPQTPSEAGEGPEATPDAEGDAAAMAPPTDPCEACAALAGRLAEIADEARRAEAFGDRDALEAAARDYAAAMRSIGLADIDPDVQPRVMGRVRDRPGSAVAMPADWPWWRELICDLEVLQVAIVNFDAVASRLGGRAASTRQDLMRLRKDSSWILGSERVDAESLREAIARLRRNLASDCLAARPSKEEEPQVEAIHAWLLLDASASPGGGEGRFDPPGGPTRPETSP